MPNFDWNEEKNKKIKAERGVSFEDIIIAITQERVITVEKLKTKKHLNQKAYIVRIREYVYVVPFVIDKKKNTHFLKTIFPSRKRTKKYL